MEKSFTKFSGNAFVTTLCSEARRVKYKVTRGPFLLKILDGEKEVLRGVKVAPCGWAVTFSTEYWTDATNTEPTRNETKGD